MVVNNLLLLLLLLPCMAAAAIHVARTLLLRRPRKQASSRSSNRAPHHQQRLHLLRPPTPNPHRALARLAESYGPIFTFKPGMTCTFVVLSSPSMAREALSENEAALASRFVPDSVRALAYGAGSMAFLPSSDPLWKHHRVTAGVFLTSGKGLAATRPVRDRHAPRLAVRLRGCSGRPVMVGEAVFAAANNAISNILFSEDVVVEDGLLGVQGVLRRRPAFMDTVAALFEEWAKPNVSDAFPFLAPLDLFGSRRRTSRNLARLYEMFHGFVERRLASGERHGDVLDAVLERHAKSQLTRSDITTNITVEWAMAHLLRHPAKMEKLRAEITAKLGPKDFVEEADIGDLPYLDAVVKETLRLHPAVPVATREVAADGVSLGGFPMAIGTCVLINLWAIGRDPAAWPDQPEVFMPERFMGGGGAAAGALGFRGSSDFAYRPFGAGRRMCPGMDFAARFVPLVLASMLHRMEWRLPETEGVIGTEGVELGDHCTLVLKLAKPLVAVPEYTAAGRPLMNDTVVFSSCVCMDRPLRCHRVVGVLLLARSSSPLYVRCSSSSPPAPSALLQRQLSADEEVFFPAPGRVLDPAQPLVIPGPLALGPPRKMGRTANIPPSCPTLCPPKLESQARTTTPGELVGQGALFVAIWD
ncbi:hypothetical protein HU200_052377 [Digitaria exilis]|uniref:Cytochrome P450 n=1 Tax=Digitaria exilis TaxID=1010633 RepID=A0A835AZ34_9POAL|nr:hypothetical protein HU200_052377 [Digitaria exilis]